MKPLPNHLNQLFANQKGWYAERNRRVYELWLSGVSEAEIAERFGNEVGYIRRIIRYNQQKEIKEANDEMC